MNYLAHLHLGGDAPAQLLGSLYGDFVKGPLKGQYCPAIEQAIALHRRIDVFTDQHLLLERAKSRFPGRQRRVASMVLDVFFDHCLALNWAEYAQAPLDQFTAKVYHTLAVQTDLPGQLELIAPRMAAQDWLGSYRDFAVLEQVLSALQRRLSRPELLEGSADLLVQLYEPLHDDFRAFYPALMRFAKTELTRL